MSALLLADSIISAGLPWHGDGSITRTLYLGDPPAPGFGRVQVFDERSGRIAAETWSDPVTGAWTASGLSTARDFLLVGTDPTGTWGAYAVDRVRASPP